MAPLGNMLHPDARRKVPGENTIVRYCSGLKTHVVKGAYTYTFLIVPIRQWEDRVPLRTLGEVALLLGWSKDFLPYIFMGEDNIFSTGKR